MITIIEETASTNADCVAALSSGAVPDEGDWIVARRQTAGRGRQGREWFDGSGNFMGSTVVELQTDDPPPPTLGFAAAMSVAHTVDQWIEGAAPIRTKWPNDVLLDGGKVCGILMEMVGKHVVVGIGVNLARAPEIEGRKTAAISDHVTAPSVDDFANKLGASFASWLSSWRIGGLDLILRDFLYSCRYSEGMPLTVHDTDGSRVEGTFAGLEQTDGALRLRLADGSERVIRAGDIS
ncbi:MAG: biotin--[acetyl-CoA-carboxylase] ligase [Pseudomonadota bacterium]